MAKFFINRPIVAMVIAILTVIVGLVAMTGLPIAQFPDIVPPEIQVATTYTGADALTVEQSVATPIEQQMSGVDDMNYMYSTNANNGQMTLKVNFDVKTDVSTDQVLSYMRQGQALSQLPTEVRDYGVTMLKSTSHPPDHVRPLFAERDLRQRLPGQLRLHQHQRPDDPGEGDRQRHRVRRRPVRHALLGEAGPAGQAQRHDPGDHQRHQRAEQGEPRRADRRGAGARGAGVHLRGPGPGAAPDRGGVRPDRRPGQPRRLHPPPEGRGARRAGRPDVQPEQAASTGSRRP